jgi:hypothetical protein
VPFSRCASTSSIREARAPLSVVPRTEVDQKNRPVADAANAACSRDTSAEARLECQPDRRRLDHGHRVHHVMRMVTPLSSYTIRVVRLAEALALD